uniref:RNA helicase n=1 Tax=Oryza brachyantha TaxID=4533 RepID=J3LAY8_ORYBR
MDSSKVCMAQQEQNMVSGRVEKQISAQAMRSKSSEKKAVQGQAFTGLFNKRNCFACNEASHTLDQCSIKERLATGAQLFAHSTRQPFYMIQPSEEVVEKEKFYHHCLLITSDVSNLDPRKVKVEVSKSWQLTNWEIRTEGRQNFLVSFNSEDDLISCLQTPRIETSINDKEVNFTVARWKEDDEENIELIRAWFLVYRVPRIYRNWKELYQIASAVGVLIDVDEDSLEGDNKEPIKLKIALRSADGAPFSCHFVFGWYSRSVTFTMEDKVQNIVCEREVLQDSNGEDHLDVFDKECKDNINEVIEIPPEILNKGVDLKSNNHDTIIVASTHNHTLDVKGCSGKELGTTEPAVSVEEPNFVEELRAQTEITSKDNNTSAPVCTTSNSGKTVEGSRSAEREQSISRRSTSMTGDTCFKATTVIHSKKITEGSSKVEGVQSTSGNSIGMIQETPFRGIQKPTVKIVYARRNKMQKRSMENQDSKSLREKEHLNELETALGGQGQKSDNESGGDGNNAIAPSAIAINSKKKQTKDSATIQGAQSISGSSIGETPTKGPRGAQLDAKQHVSKMSKHAHNEFFESFSEMGLQENLLEGIYAYGLDRPSVVHQRGIVPLCEGLDSIRQALSGTTVTLCCGILQRLDYASKECQALVLVPTCDLAQETKKVIGALGHCLGVKADAFYGGINVCEDQRILSSGVQVVVGTPCHVLGMLKGRALCPDHIRMLILDEADDIFRCCKDQVDSWLLPTKTQFGFFSATMSHEALEMCRKFMNKPVEIIVPRDEELEGINVKQFYVNIEKEDYKLDKLCDLLDPAAITRSIVVNTRRQAKSLTKSIRAKGYTVSAAHGGMNQGARDQAVQDFQSGSSSILIATDPRGIDVLHAPVVIIYDLPTQQVSYLRHVQRSRQHGRKGAAISFITHADEHNFSSIRKFVNTQIEELPSNVSDFF